MADLDRLVRRYRGEIEDYLGLDDGAALGEETLLAIETAAILVAARLRARSAGWDDDARIADIAEMASRAMTAATCGLIIAEEAPAAAGREEGP